MVDWNDQLELCLLVPTSRPELNTPLHPTSFTRWKLFHTVMRLFLTEYKFPIHMRCSDSRLLISPKYSTFRRQLPYSIRGRRYDIHKATMKSTALQKVHRNKSFNVRPVRPTLISRWRWNFNLTSTYVPKTLCTGSYFHSTQSMC